MKLKFLNDDSREYSVYKHTSPSGKVYIGYTGQGAENRWKSGMGYASQIYFFRAIVKYGWINFKHEILYEGLSLQEAKDKEIFLIAQYDSTNPDKGYNITPGGDSKNERLGKLISKGRNRGDLPKLTIPKGNTGKPVLKFDSANNQIQFFPTVAGGAYDARMHIETFRYQLNNFDIVRNEDGTYYKYKDKEHGYHRAVLMYSMDGVLLGEFYSQAEAERQTGISAKQINSVCRGNKASAGRRLWRYKDESTNNTNT